MTDESWDRILAEVKAQPVHDAPLEFGAEVCWNRVRRGITVGLTEIHRVGTPRMELPFTACGFSIAAPERRLPLTPALIRVFPKCRICEAEIKYAKEHAA